MSIIRAPRPESNFYLLNKSISEDKRLSWPARGLLVFLLGKPDHWKISISNLINETNATIRPTGRDGVYGLLEELINAGYVARKQDRATGRFGEIDYFVSETPLQEEPLTAEPYTVEPLTAQTTLVSIEEPVSIEPQQEDAFASSTSPAKPKQRARKITLEEWLEKIKDNGEKQIPLTHAVFAYADKTNIPDDFLLLAWNAFKDKYRHDHSKKYADWRLTFLNAVKGNWLRLWYIDEAGFYILTTQGLQAQRAFA